MATARNDDSVGYCCLHGLAAMLPLHTVCIAYVTCLCCFGRNMDENQANWRIRCHACRPRCHLAASTAGFNPAKLAVAAFKPLPASHRFKQLPQRPHNLHQWRPLRRHLRAAALQQPHIGVQAGKGGSVWAGELVPRGDGQGGTCHQLAHQLQSWVGWAGLATGILAVWAECIPPEERTVYSDSAADSVQVFRPKTSRPAAPQAPTCQGLRHVSSLHGSSHVISSQQTIPKAKMSAAGECGSPRSTSGAWASTGAAQAGRHQLVGRAREHGPALKWLPSRRATRCVQPDRPHGSEARQQRRAGAGCP